MAKRITKKDLEVQIDQLRLDNADIKSDLHRKEKELSTVAGKITTLEMESVHTRREFEIVKGRFTELVISHDILLRSSLRKEGMAWEDINRSIAESRQNFGGSSTMGVGGRGL